MRQITAILAALFLLVAATPVAAQQGSPPDEIELAFEDIAERTGERVTFQTVDGFQWESRDFNDTSLGCPQPDQFYSQVITSGYQFMITFAGTTYDYRISEDGSIVTLCDTTGAEPIETSPAPEPIDCGAYYEIQEGDTLVDIAQQCGFTVQEIVDINPDIEDPSVIYEGQRIAIPTTDSPYSVAIAPDSGPPGTLLTLTASGFPEGATVDYGLGRFRSEYDIFGTRTIGSSGRLTTTVAVPENIEIGTELVGVVVYNGEESISEVFEVTDVALFDQTRIYLVGLGDAGRSGQAIGCEDSLIPVDVEVSPTVAPLTAGLETIFGIDERIYADTGLYNPLYQSDLSVQDIDITNGLAEISLSGELAVGGACDVPRIEAQLRQTALQYETIDDVNITINEMPLNQVLQ